MKTLCYFIAFLCPSLAFCQEDFRNDMPFFQKKALEYQQWLEQKGLGEVLTLNKVQFKTNPKTTKPDYKELELLLLLRSHDVDTALARWNRLKRDFDSPADTLEHFLYREFTHLMEIPPAQGNIQIHVQDRLKQRVPDFHIWIWWEQGHTLTEQKIGKYRTKTFEISIRPYQPAAAGRGKAATVKKTAAVAGANQVFDRIVRYLHNNLVEHPRYRNDELDDRKPHFESDSLRSETTFECTLADLGKEVLTDQTRSFWEKWVRINTIAMERLRFHFEYQPLENGAYRLKCSIDGKYGSGVFKPRAAAYMNMETDFDDFFEKYKNDFRKALVKYLEEKP